MMRIAAWLSVLAFTSLGSLACGGQAAQSPAEPGGPKVQRLIFAVQPPTTEANDPRFGRAPTNWVYWPFYENMVGIDPETGKLAPQLATDWSLEPNGSAYRFKVRKGVQFHHGKGEFVAKDVDGVFKTFLDLPELERGYTLWEPIIKEIQVVNDHELVVQMKKSAGVFMQSFSEQRGTFNIFSPKHFHEIKQPTNDAPNGQPTMQTGPTAGTGAYQFKEREQGSFIRYEAVPYQHWRGNPDFKEFEFRFVKEASTRMAGLLTGELHMADLPDDLKAEAGQRGFKTLASKVQANRAFLQFVCCFFSDIRDYSKGWTAPESPLADMRVRRALSKAIDRDKLSKAFFSGNTQPMYSTHFHPRLEGWNPQWERDFQQYYGYDLDAAKRLLTEAGYGPNRPLQTNMLFPSEAGRAYSGGDDIADAISVMWRAAGVDVQHTTIDPVQRTAMTRNLRLTNHASLTGTSSEPWTGTTTYGSSAVSGARGAGVELAKADTALNALSETLDPKRQDELWRVVGDALFYENKDIPLFYIPVEAVVNQNIVASWSFPGSITGGWTHVYNIKAAR